MKKETMATPECECLYAFLQQPKIDQNPKFKDCFQITLVLDHKEHSALLKQIAQLNKDAKGPTTIDMPGHPIKNHFEYKEGTKDKVIIPNKYRVRFKTNAEYTDHIVTFDSQGKVLNRDKNFIANGSIVSVGWSFGNYDGGVSLYLDGVQIKELIEWKGKTFEDLGFQKTQGYESGDSVSQADEYVEPGDDIGEQDGVPVEDDPNNYHAHPLEPDEVGSPMKEEQDDLPFRRV